MRLITIGTLQYIEAAFTGTNDRAANLYVKSAWKAVPDFSNLASIRSRGIAWPFSNNFMFLRSLKDKATLTKPLNHTTGNFRCLFQRALQVDN